MVAFVKRNILYIAWLQVIVAMLGSLYASEILKWPPCVLCWYQRVAMFPLFLIIPAGIFLKDKNLPFYVLPLAIFGLIVAFYQHLLQIGLISENFSPCTFGVSCTTKYLEFPGGLTFPFISALSFAFIIICMVIFRRESLKK